MLLLEGYVVFVSPLTESGRLWHFPQLLEGPPLVDSARLRLPFLEALDCARDAQLWRLPTGVAGAARLTHTCHVSQEPQFRNRDPLLIQAAKGQLTRVTLTVTSRAFHNDQLAPFCTELADVVAIDLVLPVTSGDAVETALKPQEGGLSSQTGIQPGRATPFTPGFRFVEYGDSKPTGRSNRRDHGGRAPGTGAE